MPEEQGCLAPLGPKEIRRNQGFANHTQNPLALNWWFGAGDTLVPRLTYKRHTHGRGWPIERLMLLPSDGLYRTTDKRSQIMIASRIKTVCMNWSSGSTDSLLTMMGINLASQDTPNWDPVSTITTPWNRWLCRQDGLNGIIINIQAPTIQALVADINDLAATTEVTVSAISFPAIPGVTPPGSYQRTFTPARAESLNQASAFIEKARTSAPMTAAPVPAGIPRCRHLGPAQVHCRQARHHPA